MCFRNTVYIYFKYSLDKDLSQLNTEMICAHHYQTEVVRKHCDEFQATLFPLWISQSQMTKMFTFSLNRFPQYTSYSGHDYLTVCVFRDFRAGSDEGNRGGGGYLLRRAPSDESLAPFHYSSRPPTRSGSRPSSTDSLRHTIGG